MIRWTMAIGLVLLSLGAAKAQFAYPLTGSPYMPQGLGMNPAYSTNPNSGRPVVSPYLNLLNGNFPALNYYGGVRPLLQNQNNLAQQQQQPMAQLNRGPFFQQQPAATKLFTVDEDAEVDTKRSALTSPGGAVSFGNFNGSSRAGVQQGGSFFNRGQQGAGPARR